ncbi:TonB-dependent siderophore receptor [Litchfieldella xinjiangensis]|uniref:TonB-dependent siderophore receptor n=1 Tax=Litchfieldella xinjiangensis TaxID=1166948 RepID=UPI0005BE8A93|nr:TonB-dependent siderophore receptor [Halomonas xinjiangensis]
MAHSPARRIPHPLATAIRQAMGLSLTGLMLAAPSLVLAQDTGQDEAVESDTMVVVGTALKVDAPLVETPRPVSTVNREELDERNVQQLDETFRYRSGVLSGHYGSDNDTNWFKVRGFDQSTYQDGLRLYQEGYYYSTPEPYGLESVEVFKGPSSILYGEAPPGGMINAISKRPTEEQQGRFDIQAGNRDHRQVGIDTSGPLTESGDVRYRFVGTYKERDGDLDHTYNDRYYLAPSLEFDVNEDTMLTLLASFQRDDGIPTNPFKPIYGTVESTPFGEIDRSTNLGEPGYERNERTQASLGYELDHYIDDTWRLEHSLRYSEMELDLISIYSFRSSGDLPRETNRGLAYRDGKTETWTTDNRFVGNWNTDRLENTLLLGLDYQDLKNKGEEYDDFAYGTIDMFSPSYGNYTRVTDGQLAYREIKKEQFGVYVQDQLRIDDKWVLLGSARYDKVSTDNVSTGSVQQEGHRNDSEVSFSGGVMYLAENGISPYLSYTESFEALTSFGADGLYEPRKGKQWEVGVKYAPLDWDGYVAASVFDLSEENSIYGYTFTQSQIAERSSTGLELEAVGYVTDELQLTAAYTYTDARIDQSEEIRDQRASLIPRHMASTWLDYAFTQGTVAGLKLGAGVRYVGESVDGDVKVNDFTLLDAMASYDFANNWRAQINVNNVTDEDYVASCDTGWCYYGESRSVIGSLSYRW